MTHIIGGNYGRLHPDLTPFDVQLAGYMLRECGEGGAGVCTWRRLGGGGEEFGVCYVDAADAIRDARWLMTAQRGQMVLIGLGV